jgi:hypothetical protein
MAVAGRDVRATGQGVLDRPRRRRELHDHEVSAGAFVRVIGQRVYIGPGRHSRQGRKKGPAEVSP